jgi:glutaredoxin
VKVEVLYFDGCPSYAAAEKTLRGVLKERGLEVEMVAVETDEEAGRLRFPGSPTIRVEGEDLFPASAPSSARTGGSVAGSTPRPGASRARRRPR